MSSPKAPSAPQPTAEERALTAEQLEALRQQRLLLDEQLRTQDLLAPFLYQEVGLRPIMSSEVDPALITRRGELETQLSALKAQWDAVPLKGGDPARLAIEAKMAPLQTEQRKLLEQIDVQSKGRITGFEELPDDPEVAREKLLQQRFQEASLAALDREAAGAEANAEIERLTRERSLAALKGELPVNPALLNQLARDEENLRGQLFKQLGPGFETSTPGIQALGEFMTRKNEILEGARRADLTLGEQLRFSQEAGSRESAVTGADLSARIRQQQLGNLMGISTAGMPGIGAQGQVAAGFAQPMQYFQNLRNEQFGARMQEFQGRVAQNQMYGNLFGSALGAYATYAALA